MQKITTWLWFETQAEEAARFYVSVFRNAKLGEIMHAPGGGEPHVHEGDVLTVGFEIEGKQFFALNGGAVPDKPNMTVSHLVLCADQAEIDDYWTRLIADGGKEVQCGWVTDKYGYAWQIVPENLLLLMSGPNRERAARIMAAMQQMIKLDIAALEAA